MIDLRDAALARLRALNGGNIKSPLGNVMIPNIPGRTPPISIPLPRKGPPSTWVPGGPITPAPRKGPPSGWLPRGPIGKNPGGFHSTMPTIPGSGA